MQQLQLPTFLPLLAPFVAETLSPVDASRLALTITELLIDHYVDLPLLKFLSRFLTQDSYDDIVEERNIEHACGYILCNNAPKHQVRRMSSTSSGATAVDETRFQIYNRKPKMILPNTFASQYCCKDHYQASLFYRNQLSTEALFARKDILVVPPFPDHRGAWYENGITCLEEVLAKHREYQQQGKSLAEVVQMMNGLSVADDSKDTSELIRLLQDFEIVEREGGLNGEDLDSEDETAAHAIDGYITTNKSFGGYVV